MIEMNYSFSDGCENVFWTHKEVIRIMKGREKFEGQMRRGKKMGSVPSFLSERV